MPEAAKAMLATMKSHFESKTTGRTATIQGVEGEEREVVMTVDAPAAPNVPPGEMMRLVMHIWTAKSSETLRVPAVREVAGYNVFANAVMNPMASMEKAFRQMPGFADNPGAIFKETQSGGTPVVLRMEMQMFMPMIGAMMKQAPAGKNPFGAGFDADAPFVTMNQELVELSTAAVPESVFQIPQGYQPAQAADILKAMTAAMVKAQGAAK